MDTLTHIVLGACIGEVMAGKHLGKKALFIGAFAQSVPDLDFLASFWLPTSSDLLAHRGFTHSFTFLLLSAPLFALLSAHFFRKDNMPLRRWILFWGVQIFVHLFIDSFNAYGTGLFEPFSHYRVSFNTLFVADPLFSIWPALACIALLILRRTTSGRSSWAWMGLSLSILYLLGSIAFKFRVDATVKSNLHNNHIVSTRYFTTPTPLNDLLWYIVAENDSGYFIGYRSVFDKEDQINFHYTNRNDSLLTPYKNTTDLDNLLRFSQGYYAASFLHDTLVFNDLRFGEILGWTEPHPKFVFYYYLQYPADNKMIVQRGRFAGWNTETLRLFLKRIAGN